MSTDEDLPEIAGVDPTPIHHPVDDEAIASAVNEAAAEVADAAIDVAMAAAAAAAGEPEAQDPASEGLVHDIGHEMVDAAAAPDDHHQDQDVHHESMDGASSLLPNGDEEDEHIPQISAEDNQAQGETTSGEPQVPQPVDQLKTDQVPCGASEAADNSKKETKKRIRRVGKVPSRKLPKLDGTVTAPLGSATPGETMIGSTTTTPVEAMTVVLENGDAIPRVVSKHDEKWNNMFQKLVAYQVRQSSLV